MPHVYADELVIVVLQQVASQLVWPTPLLIQRVEVDRARPAILCLLSAYRPDRLVLPLSNR